MKKLSKLFKLYFHKEKVIILTIIFILLNISIYIAYKQSIYSSIEYYQTYNQAGLDFFYHIHTIGVTPFLFFIFLLCITNIVSYDFLTLHQNHFSYQIITRTTSKSYYLYSYIQNIILTFLSILCFEILILGIIHFFYLPIHFQNIQYPDLYYAKSQILSNNQMISLISFILCTSIGYSIVSSIIFSLQCFMTNKYVYRCFGVIFGILLVVIPALIQGYLAQPDFAFLLQVNNIVALGMENVRANPFGLSNLFLFILSSAIYSMISYLIFQFFMKWRHKYD